MTANMNVEEIKEIIPPHVLNYTFQPTEVDLDFVNTSRKTIENILTNEDKRLLVIVGPCSIHDYDSAIEYAKLLKNVKENYENLFLVMRVYFEKPRSRTGWKGFIYDPDLNDTFDINNGITLARKLLLEITKMRIPIGCEFLDTITPQYLSDLVSWGAIGARTSESQIHRQLASGLSMPIGFKNLTNGDYKKAIDGIISASYQHNFLGIDSQGRVAHVRTKGNKYGHLILRGGDLPNYHQKTVEDVSNVLEKEGLNTGFVIDCSHGNSQKIYNRQLCVALFIKRLRLLNKYPVVGIMIESNINKGSQKISSSMQKGVSITDSCIDFITTDNLLTLLNTSNVENMNSLTELRKLIREYDIAIDTNKLLNKSVLTDYLFEADKQIPEFCESETQMMNVSMRFALSEKVAELKFNNDPFSFLLKQNDFLSLITNRDVEKDNLNTFNNNIYLKIMEISKNLQVEFLETYTSNVKIGYLYGKGSFSHEAVQNFRGTHIAFDNIKDMVLAYTNKTVDFILVPTYNSIIGSIELYPITFTKKGSIEHAIELNLYSTTNSKIIDKLFIEPHIEKEVSCYIKNLKYKELQYVKSTVEGCKKILECTKQCCATIASAKNECNLYYTIERNIVNHNITTFSLY